MRTIHDKMSHLLLRRRPCFIAIFQACLAACSLLLAWLLRFDFTLPDRRILFDALPLLVLARLAGMASFGLFRGWWKYAGISDGIDIIKAVGTGSVLFFLATRYLFAAESLPRSVYVLEAMLTTGLLAGVRLLTRVLAGSMRADVSTCKRVILIGAGSAAQSVLQEIRLPGSGYEAVGCLDDDPSKRGVRINNVAVLGTVDQLPGVLSSQPADEVLIAVPSATGPQMRRFVNICNREHISFRTVPALKDILAGEVIVSQLREVRFEDLLGRDPIQIDLESVRNEITGRTVVVTGAAGSIGSELCRQLLECNPDTLVCFDQSETGLFFLRRDLDKPSNGTRVAICVVDITDMERIRKLFSEFAPDIIFHAAAYKHVPLMESNVQEAVKNNVLGLVGLLDLAEESGCGNFVLISSDKAVNPTNVMGATKRICELVLSSRPPNGMRCVSVRFGNVLGSSGSVIPVLKEQLHKNEPLTVTHPEMTRFFMTTREAVTLVLQAFAIGDHRDILVLDMGEPVRILDLARTLIRLSGKFEPDVEIQFTGLREGEKLHEELFYENEQVISTAFKKIKRTSAPIKDWNELRLQLDQLRASMTIDGAAPIRAEIKRIVPEYVYQPESTRQIRQTVVQGTYIEKGSLVK
jgi:FlaA1/EpsC-like NDP-sugar epimerase